MPTALELDGSDSDVLMEKVDASGIEIARSTAASTSAFDHGGVDLQPLANAPIDPVAGLLEDPHDTVVFVNGGVSHVKVGNGYPSSMPAPSVPSVPDIDGAREFDADVDAQELASFVVRAAEFGLIPKFFF